MRLGGEWEDHIIHVPTLREFGEALWKLLMGGKLKSLEACTFLFSLS